jgi:ZIP family zinc transporter
MTQIIVRHYARPATHRRLWTGLTMTVVALAFVVEQASHWLAA